MLRCLCLREISGMNQTKCIIRVGDLAYALLSIIGEPMPQERGAEVEFNRFKQLQYAGSDAFWNPREL